MSVKKTLAFSLCAILLSACSMNSDKEADQKTIELVNRAATLIETKGRAAFSELSGKDWYQGEQYVFVLGFRGKILVHPAQPHLVGKVQTELQDADGTLIIKEFIEQLTSRDDAWVEYRWPKPGSEEASDKRSYLKKATAPNEAAFIVGAGYYK